MSKGSLATPADSAHTTAILSECTLMVDDCHACPQTATAITTGTIYFAAM